MKKYTIFGNPVKHSKSPAMHNEGFRCIKFDAIYTKTLLDDGEKLKKSFLEGNFKGANITVPFKELAFRQADIVDEFAEHIGAINTFILDNGKVKGYNTDAPGFFKSIEKYKDVKNVLLLGAGGTSKAIAVYLQANGYSVSILNRSDNSKNFFCNLGCNFYQWNDFSSQVFDMIVNCTSAGLSDDEYPVPIGILENLLESSVYAIDCIYGKLTPFLQLAKKKGCIFKDGEDMLLFQGVLAFELFTDTKANSKVIEAMREALINS